MPDRCQECGKELNINEKTPCNNCTAFNYAINRLHNARKLKDITDTIINLPSDEDRCTAITYLKEFMCLNCGALDPSCRCWDDE